MTRTDAPNEADAALNTIINRTGKGHVTGADNLGSKEGQFAVASKLNKVLDPEHVHATVAFTNKSGFQSVLARDVFNLDGNKDDAERAETMVELLGEPLAEALRTRALSSGVNNECDWLAQQLQVAFENDEFDTKGAADQRTKEDDDVNSHYNRLISKMLGKSNLGRVVQHAKMAKPELSNPECLRWGVLNLINLLRARGI